ncbi:MAG: outer membrane beta-barrel protein [Treponema sp.]|uniref:outer membrane beta-barrel protein n=1 Tax=Treponema sp. TaxID=166 RepID=UPI0025F27EC1|nr:outer membrane beta-barrel protein [Treponema sp.]MBQ8678296.1 outer membrane beta-barrel protein [Treponema sp.]
MKKLITTLVVGTLLLSSSFAQLSQMSFGVRGSLGVSDMTIADETKKGLGNELNAIMIDAGFPYSSSDVDNKPIVGGGFAFWGNYSFEKIPALGLQAELGFLFNNGTELTAETKSGTAKIEIKDKATYTTMELPFLVTYTVNKGGFFEFIPQAGFYLSFPIGKIKQDLDMTFKNNGNTLASKSESSKDKIDNACIFGTAFGADFAFNFNKTSALLLNARYMIDLGELKSDGDIGTRKVFLMSAGYRYTFR